MTKPFPMFTKNLDTDECKRSEYGRTVRNYLLVCVGLLTLFGETAVAAAYDDKVIVNIERFKTCVTCTAYELTIYGDGTSLFNGKDGTRRRGLSGSAIFRDRQRHEQEKAKKAGVVFDATLDYLDYLKGNLDSSIRDLQSLLARRGSLKKIIQEDGIDRPTSSEASKVSLDIALPNGMAERVTFYQSQNRANDLGRILQRFEALHQFPADFIPVAGFSSDKNAVFLLQRIDSVLQIGPNCWGGPDADLNAILYADRRVVVYGYRYNVPSNQADWSLTANKPYLLFREPPPHLPTYLRFEATLPQEAFDRLMSTLSADAVALQKSTEHWTRTKDDVPTVRPGTPEFDTATFYFKLQGKTVTFRIEEISKEWPHHSKALNQFRTFSADLLPPVSSQSRDYCATTAKHRQHVVF